MDDKQIIRLFFERDENAISRSEEKYGKYCHTVAVNILGNSSDAEECVNETWLAAWNNIPPEKPDCLRAYFGRITRNVAIARSRDLKRLKRGGSGENVPLEEIEDFVCGDSDPEKEVGEKELAEAIDGFLASLSKRDRDIFVSRYFLAFPTSEISERFGMKEDYVRTLLSRSCKKLKKYLERKNLL